MNMAIQINKTKAEQDYPDFFEAVSNELPGDEAVQTLRNKAIGQFEELGLPNRRVEEWKYTDLKAFFKEAYKPAGKDSSKLTEDELATAYGALANLDCYRIVFVNGQYRLDKLGYGEGIDVQPMSKLFTEKADWVAEHLGKAVEFPENDATLALNSAFMQDGITIRISGQIEKPVHVVFVNRGEEAHSVSLRNIIILEDGAKATVVEHYVTIGDTSFQTNAVTETFIGKEANFHHLKIQDENIDSGHLSTWTAQIGEKAQYNSFHATVGAALSRDQLKVRFDGENAALNFGSVFLGRGKQVGDTTLTVDHAVPHCESRELYKGVMDDTSRGVFQGKLMVRQIAQKTDGKQMAQALLLTEEAEFDAKPELEIFADDVVCGHGATSGQIDEELLFYLMSRGIPKDEAKSLLIQAFVGEALELVESDDIRDGLTDIVVKWLGRS